MDAGGDSPSTVLKRSGVVSYIALLVQKIAPSHWSKPVCLLRFVEESGASTVFIATGDALRILGTAVMWTVYHFNVPGKAVRTSSRPHKYGAHGRFEVHLRYPPSHFRLHRQGVNIQLPYRFVAWPTLQDLSADSIIDFYGIVVGTPTLSEEGPIAKCVVKLGQQDLYQEVIVLGDHARRASFVAGDRVAFSGLRLKEWRGQRTLETALLTTMQKNPEPCDAFPVIDVIETGAPPRKLLRHAPQELLTVAEASHHLQGMLRAARDGSLPQRRDVCIQCKIAPATASFFKHDAPLVGSEGKEQMCWKSSLVDVTGALDVKVWDKPCQDIFEVNAGGLRALWERGGRQRGRTGGDLAAFASKHEHAFQCFFAP